MSEGSWSEESVATLVLTSIDYVWGRVRARLDGLTQDEYMWEPVEGCWSVRERDGVALVERVEPEPDPAPVTTIAWRLWHIAADCLAGFTAGGLSDWPLDVRDRDWYLDVGRALSATDTAWSAFRSGLDRLGGDGLHRELGAAWGPYARDTWAGLVIHTLDEIAHHGAEIALLRDLYRARV